MPLLFGVFFSLEALSKAEISGTMCKKFKEKWRNVLNESISYETNINQKH